MRVTWSHLALTRDLDHRTFSKIWIVGVLHNGDALIDPASLALYPRMLGIRQSLRRILRSHIKDALLQVVQLAKEAEEAGRAVARDGAGF